MLQINNIGFEYPDQEVLNNVSLSVDSGQLLHLKGKNGAGKSTLIKIIAGLLTPHRGDVLLNHHSIYDDLLAYQKQLSFIGHKPGYHQLLTPSEIFSYLTLDNHQRNQLQQLIHKFKISQYLDSPFYTFSAGTKRKISLMMLLSSPVKIWLLDEPLVSIDEETISVVVNELVNHLDGGGICIMTSHQFVPLPGLIYQEYQL